jgi:hypothetical protein
VKHIAPNIARIASLGEYLKVVSKSIAEYDQFEPAGSTSTPGATSAPGTTSTAGAAGTSFPPVTDSTPEFALNPAVASPEPAAAAAAARVRFNALLIVSDVLHADKFHLRSTAKPGKRPTLGIFSREAMAYIPELVLSAASLAFVKDSPIETKLRGLLNFWAINRLIPVDDMRLLRRRTDDALVVAQGGTPVRRISYLLPKYHGDSARPHWSTLPASYMVEPLLKAQQEPIMGHHLEVQKLDSKAVSPYVHQLLENYFENIDLKYYPTGDNPTGETLKYKLWLNHAGHIVKQNKVTGEKTTVSTAYGWTPKFCRDLKIIGLPENIVEAREEAVAKVRVEKLAKARENADRVMERKRRRMASHDDDDWPDRDTRRVSYSSYGNDSYSSSASRPGSRDQPSWDRGGSNDGGRTFNDLQRDQPSLPPFDRNSSGSGQQWSTTGGPNRGTPTGPSNTHNSISPQNFSQGFALPPSTAFSAPPPMPPFPFQFPMMPFQPGAFAGGLLPTMPGAYPPPPHMPLNMARLPHDAPNLLNEIPAGYTNPSLAQSRVNHGNDGSNHFRGSFGNNGGNQPRGSFGSNGGNQFRGSYGNNGGNHSRGNYGNNGGNQSRGSYGNNGNNQSRGGYGNNGSNQSHGGYGNNASDHSHGGYGTNGESQMDHGRGNGGRGQNQGNFQGNSQGNFQGNSRSGPGGFRGNNRGGHGGQQRGQRGGRW